MVLFNPEQQRVLAAAVVDAYNVDSLGRLCRFHLGKRLDVLVSLDQGLGTLVDRLILDLESRGWMEEFVRGVHEDCPGNELVQKFCEQHARFVFSPRTATTDLARDVGSALSAVAGRVTDPADPVRQVLVGQATRSLSDLGVQFRRLRKYKGLHDCLHSLQFKYAKAIPTELRVFREDPSAADNLLTYFQEMADELAQARPACAGLESQAAEELWLNVAEESVRRMRVAVTAPEPKPNDVAKGYQLLEGLLRVQPTRINELLTGLLERLQLDRLRDTLGQLATANEDIMSRAVTALGRLTPRLGHILTEHKDWQLIDLTLHQIDTELKLGSGVEQCSFLWSEVGKILNPMLDRDRMAAWSIELRQLGSDLGTAFGTADVGRVQVAFKRLMPRAMWFFYQTDKDLKELSGELDKLGDKLGDILREVGHGVN